MKKRSFAATVVAMGLVLIPGVHAKTLEDVLKEKGVITEEDYKEVTRSKPLNYKPGKGFTLTSADEKFQLSLGGRLQTRYTFTDADDNGTSRDSNKIEVKRMKFWLNGYAYTKDLTYLLQVDFVQGGSSKLLEHAYLNYRFVDEAQVLAGQTKVPFGRQWLNSSGSQQFVDRSTASDMFRPGYEAGVKVHGAVAGGIATYELGYYGGAGQSTFRTSNDNAYAARITANPFGKMAYARGTWIRAKNPSSRWEPTIIAIPCRKAQLPPSKPTMLR
ncbi:porin [Geotalea toluenoxydans]|uniref:porin n=1 Tax=Geotalea toluenoxydans TaxID=421624 RepID=UPI000AA7B86E|nr:porin [Geotalea toluenoxydans]